MTIFPHFTQRPNKKAALQAAFPLRVFCRLNDHKSLAHHYYMQPGGKSQADAARPLPLVKRLTIHAFACLCTVYLYTHWLVKFPNPPGATQPHQRRRVCRLPSGEAFIPRRLLSPDHDHGGQSRAKRRSRGSPCRRRRGRTTLDGQPGSDKTGEAAGNGFP